MDQPLCGDTLTVCEWRGCWDETGQRKRANTIQGSIKPNGHAVMSVIFPVHTSGTA